VSEHVKLVVPDLGDFSDVEVIEILVQTGDSVEVEDGLVTLETDKASMDVPASQAGKIVSVEIAVGDTVSSGDVVAKIEVSESTPSDDDSGESWDVKTQRMTPEEIQAVMGAPVTGDATHSTQLVVIGSGPGGYTAAFRAADLGLDVILVEKDPYLGGVCLNVGCIPSKALLHAAKVIDDAAAMGDHGVVFGPPKIEAARLVDWKNKVVGRLTGGLAQLAKQRKVRVITATAIFESNKLLALDNGESIAFENCIIAAGSEPFMLPGLPDDPRIVDSTGALEVHPLPKQLLVVGGGIIGLEMACVYSALGVEVSVVELLDSLMPGTDKDLLRPFLKIVKPRYKAIMTSTNVTGMRATTPGIEVTFEGKNAPPMGIYDRVLVAVGRRLLLAGAPMVTSLMPVGRASKWTRTASLRSISRCGQTCLTFLQSVISPVDRCWHTRRHTRQKWPRRLPLVRRVSSMRARFRRLRIPTPRLHGLV
jgi:dihydrolipoamide dehydrogenase